MNDIVYTSVIKIKREGGPLRSAYLPAETVPVKFGVHGAIAKHYGIDVSQIEQHATTIDYVIAAAGG